MKAIKNITLLCVFLISLSMMSGAFAASSPPNEKQINVKVNQVFTIQVPFWHNGWGSAYNPAYIHFISQENIGNESTNLVFKADTNGTVNLMVSPWLLGTTHSSPDIQSSPRKTPLADPQDLPETQFYHITISP